MMLRCLSNKNHQKISLTCECLQVLIIAVDIAKNVEGAAALPKLLKIALLGHQRSSFGGHGVEKLQESPL
jgi:hypothetical protein